MESESLERDSQSLSVSVRANKLCSEEQYTVIVTFGVRSQVTAKVKSTPQLQLSNLETLPPSLLTPPTFLSDPAMSTVILSMDSPQTRHQQ